MGLRIEGDSVKPTLPPEIWLGVEGDRVTYYTFLDEQAATLWATSERDMARFVWCLEMPDPQLYRGRLEERRWLEEVT